MSAASRTGRDLGILVAGQFVSVVGDGLASVAVLWWVLQTTGSAAWMGAVAAVSAACAVAASPVAGVVADRFDRRRLMMAVDLLRGAFYGALAALAATGHLPLWAVFALLGAARAAGGFFLPALMASLPRIAPPGALQRVNGLLSLAQSGGQISGAALGGVLIAAAGIGSALGADAVSFLVSVASLALIAIPPVQAAARTAGAGGWLADMRDGFGFVRSDAVVRGLIVLAVALNALGSAISVLLPVLAAGPLQAGARGYGWLAAGTSSGILLGSAGASATGRSLRRGWSLFGMLGATGAAIAALGTARSLAAAVACAVTAGALIALVNVAFRSILQARVPGAMQGRVFSLLGGVGQGLAPLSQAAAGALTSLWSAGTVVFACGGALAGTAGAFGLAQAAGVQRALDDAAALGGRTGAASGPRAGAGSLGAKTAGGGDRREDAGARTPE